MIDPAEDILKQYKNQTQQNETYTHNEQLNNVQVRNNTSDTQQESTQHNSRNNSKRRNITKINEQKDSLNNLPLHSNIKEPNKKSDPYTWTRYEIIIWQQDWLTFEIIKLHIDITYRFKLFLLFC